MRQQTSPAEPSIEMAAGIRQCLLALRQHALRLGLEWPAHLMAAAITAIDDEGLAHQAADRKGEVIVFHPRVR